MKQDYLAKALDAERLAREATDPVEKRYWHNTAAGYRRLAVFLEPRARDAAWGQRDQPDGH